MAKPKNTKIAKIEQASDNSYYWDINRTLSYNSLFNFIIGMRGVGKTYGSLKWVINHYLKTGNQFLYVRRYKEELKKLTMGRSGRLFNAVQDEFPELNLYAASNELGYTRATDDRKSPAKAVIGYAQPLSTASILKSDAMPNVTTIIFDEFIIDNSGTYHYLKDEVRKFLDLYETVARGREVRVLFLSNAVTVSNPYFDYFHLDKPRETDIQRFGQTKDLLVEFTVNEKLQEIKKNTRFGQIIQGSEYSDYAYDNQWLLDNEDFLGHKTQRSRYYGAIRYKNLMLGIWYDEVQCL